MIRELAMAMELPFIPIAAVLIGGGLGYVLDKKLGTAPLFTLVTGLVGFAAGLWQIIRRVKSNPK
jgi:ATP synthase protein I